MKIRKGTHHGRIRWLADGGTRGGKRRRKWFDLKKDAEKQLATWAAEDRAVGNVWLALEPQDQAEVLRILDEIGSAGFSLREVWEGFKAEGGDARAIEPITLGDAIKACLEEKRAANRRPVYLAQLENQWGVFARGMESTMVHELTSAEVRRWVFEAAATRTRKSRRERVETLLNWCVRHKHARENVATAVERISVEHGRPAILSVRECRALMKAAWEIDRGACGELALLLFAGVRPAEAQRLKPTDVDLKRGRVDVSGAAAKTRDRRITVLSENAVAWLRRSRPRGARAAAIPMGKNRRRRLDAIRTKAKVRTWAHDVLRHTAASHMMAKLGAAETSNQLGHSEQMLFQHYRDVVTPEDSEQFWKIAPPAR